MEIKENYSVSGYATTFDNYPLMEVDGITYYEKISPNAFDNVDMSDVILQFDHSGAVFARTKNGTLFLEVDNKGLKIKADLSKTEASRNMFNEIKETMITKMSWAFTVEEEEYDEETRTRIIKKVKKIYDTSFVSRPANENTSIKVENEHHERSARTFIKVINGLIDKRQLDKEKSDRIERVKNEYLNILHRYANERNINNGGQKIWK